MDADLERRIAELEDRAAITEVMVRYAWGLDLADWELYGSTLADEVLIDFRGSGMERRTWARDEWCDFAAQALGGVDARQHLATNVLVELDGDRATCRSALFAQAYLAGAAGGDENVHHGTYECELVRSESGWRITKLTTISGWISGNESLFEQAGERLGGEGV